MWVSDSSFVTRPAESTAENARSVKKDPSFTISGERDHAVTQGTHRSRFGDDSIIKMSGFDSALVTRAFGTNRGTAVNA